MRDPCAPATSSWSTGARAPSVPRRSPRTCSRTSSSPCRLPTRSSRRTARAWYEEQLAADGLSLAAFPRAVFGASLRGDYRPLVVLPRRLEHRLLSYSDVRADLVDDGGFPKADLTGDRRALWLRFELPSSSYATMLFREVLKAPTDLLAQKERSREANTQQDAADSEL